MSYLKRVERQREANRRAEQKHKNQRGLASAAGRYFKPDRLVASTTSWRDTVLPDELSPAFSKKSENERKLRRFDKMRAKGWFVYDVFKAKLLDKMKKLLLLEPKK